MLSLPMKTIITFLLSLIVSPMPSFSEDSSQYKIIEIRDFFCPELKGITFKYPVFKDWEVKRIGSWGKDSCTMFFNWPSIIDYESAPKVSIQKLGELGQESMVKELSGGREPSENMLDDSGMKMLGIMASKKKNPAGIPYEYKTDPSLYVVGHVFKTEDWDYLVFYGQDFGVRISRNMFGSLHYKDGEKREFFEFGDDAFYKMIIESFKFQTS